MGIGDFRGELFTISQRSIFRQDQSRPKQGKHEGNIHRVLEFSATRVQDSLLREVRFPDTTREIIEGHSVGARTFDKGVEEKIQLFGPVKKNVLVEAGCAGGARLRQSGIRVGRLCFL